MIKIHDNMSFKKTIKEIMILLILAIVTAFTANHFSVNGIALFGSWDTSSGVITARPKNEVINHTLEIENTLIAKKFYDSGKAIFIDARSEEQYNEGHIEGAISVPIHLFGERIDQLLNNYPVSTMLVTYCSGRECSDSHELAQLLFDSGYSNIKVFIDGFPEWHLKGYPIE